MDATQRLTSTAQTWSAVQPSSISEWPDGGLAGSALDEKQELHEKAKLPPMCAKRRLIGLARRIAWTTAAVGMALFVAAIVAAVQGHDAAPAMLVGGVVSVPLAIVLWLVLVVLNARLTAREERKPSPTGPRRADGEVVLASSLPLARDSLRIVSTPWLHSARVVAGFAVLVLLVDRAVVWRSGGNASFFLGIGCLLLGTAGVGLLFGRDELKEARELLAGRHLLAHWRLDATETRSFAERARQECRKQSRWLGLVGWGVGSLPAAWFLLTDAFSNLLWSPAFIAAVGAGLGCSLAIAVIDFWRVERGFQADLRTNGEIVIGYRGVFVNGNYESWGAGTRGQVLLTPGTPAIVRVRVRDTVYGRGGRKTTESIVEFPVPRRNESEIPEVARALGTVNWPCESEIH